VVSPWAAAAAVADDDAGVMVIDRDAEMLMKELSYGSKAYPIHHLQHSFVVY